MNGNGTPERRRPIEREYLATLNAVVSLDKWRAICEKAADAALAGDARAREWLSKWLLATESRPLTVLAAEESDAAPEAVADAEVTARRERIELGRRADEQNRLLLESLCSGRA
ncbi:MAG: hypothetical protein ACLQLG_19770 [Thermoguttaceae bacterium]